MSLVILFGETTPEVDRRKYVKEKLEAFFDSGEDQQENVDVVCSHESAKLPILEQKQFPRFADEKLVELRNAEACFLKEVNNQWKPAAGEKIIDDLITYSTSLTSQIKYGSPVLRRTTNLGTIYFVKPQMTFTMYDAQPRGFGVVTVASELLVSFAKGMASCIGSKLIEQIFGSNSQIDTRQLCKELAKIVKDANAEQTVLEQSGKIDSAQNCLTFFYKNEKETNPGDRVSLNNTLKDQRDLILNPALNTLRQENFKRKGISVFITGANVMLSLLQEMAIVDPIERDYKKSASYKSYKDMLAQYINYLQGMRKLVTDERLAEVTQISCKDECSYVPPGEVICSYHCRYRDNFTGSHYDFTNDKNKSNAKQKAEESRNKLVSDLKKELNWMDDVVKGWQDALNKA
jgi:hypothetical protein